MDYVIICAVAVVVAALNLFSGFGLGTVLMPVFALFFPLEVAIAATAVVHLANNIFKVFLVGRQADWGVVARFALPGAITAMIGAALLTVFVRMQPLYTYTLGARSYDITLIKLVVGGLIISSAMLQLHPTLSQLAFDRKYLALGGALSGFFGGLSGNQGALRSAFLLKAGLGKEAFVGTGTVASVIVDIARLVVYGLSFYLVSFAGVREIQGLVIAASLAAFTGAFLGSRLLKKLTWRTLQLIVGVLLLLVGLGMVAGWL